MADDNKARVILMAAQKGGVQKTSTIINMTSVSHYEGNKRLVVIDTDAQKSSLLWGDDFRNNDHRVKSLENFFPVVTPIREGYTLEEMVTSLRGGFDEIYIDTAGYIGDETGAAKRILEEAIPLADIIVTPVKVGRSETRSAFSTMKFVDEVLAEHDKNTKRVLLATDVHGRDKGYQYLQELLDEKWDEYKDNWTLLKNYIPFSTVVVKNMDKGGSAFFPIRVNSVVTASIFAYREMMKLLGRKTANETVQQLLEELPKRFAQIKAEARAETADDDEE